MVEIKDLTVEEAIKLLVEDVTDEKLKNIIQSSFDEYEDGACNPFRDIIQSIINRHKEEAEEE